MLMQHYFYLCSTNYNYKFIPFEKVLNLVQTFYEEVELQVKYYFHRE